ncbi:MAG: hypothetical protein COX80_04315 [Candidatus Magasanikbacteria bacterium CG_4_10_14_0_2_um_filter_33_14]|uniref:Uncharacterized protein n=1 Tax=Candidatus Magasanikbacteria bacterium CG_4_10_14_0_2_um_filter_33_14 TaxID=1974636 RepID=A0A2M7V9G0_9BACT|nr:MAG: hypothetical protein COX80_04315 [Candidatus Magasanikbacteria bacterium CG_4_10_14_0_2_um_filter_33_14]
MSRQLSKNIRLDYQSKKFKVSPTRQAYQTDKILREFTQSRKHLIEEYSLLNGGVSLHLLIALQPILWS